MPRKKKGIAKRAVQELLEDTPENISFSYSAIENYWNTDIINSQ
jgi:hypothetical protein